MTKPFLLTLGASVLALLVGACGDSTGDGGAGGTGTTASSPQTGTGTGTSASGSTKTGASTSGTAQQTSASTGASPTSTTGGTTTGGGQFAPLSVELCNVVNEYRVSQGLVAVPVSVSLMTVAETHVADLDAHPDILQGGCNLHSWSNTSADFGGCCYTPDHAQAQCMWDKPRELTDYTGNGYEIAASGTPTAQGALDAWKGSPPHHEVILNAGQWANLSPWPAMGCGILNGYAVVWFGDAVDPDTL